jgi:hypothetical protein
VSYDPTQAGDPPPRKFKNVVRCVANEVITMAEAVTRGRYQALPEGVGEGEPYWDFYFVALDAKWLSDGSFLAWPAAGRLYTKEGRRQDNTQRPYRVSIAFAGLPEKISVFPGDPEGKFDAFCKSIGEGPMGANPSYDAAKILDRVFLVELEEMEVGRHLPLPLVAYPEGYIYTGKVRELGSSTGPAGVNAEGAAAPATNTLVDIMKPGGENELKKVLAIINGQPIDTDFFDLLRTSGVDNRTLINGESVLGVAVTDGALPDILAAAGNITVEDGRIAVSN